jgi:hypothetical protein
VQPVLILLFGWLLGLFSPIIVDAMKSKRDAKLGREAIQNELNEFSSVILAACFKARSASGNLDRPYLKWAKKHLEAEGVNERSLKFLNMTNQMLGFPDDQIIAGSHALATADGKATLLQKYSVPLLDYRVSALQTFNTDIQRRLLEIRRNISLLDSIVDQSCEFYRMTFSQLPGGQQ